MDFVGNEFDFSTVADVDDYEPLPEGQYHVVVSDVENKRSSAGNPMWLFHLVVLDGPYRGRKLTDQVTFTENGIKRVKFVLSHLADVDVSGKVNLSDALRKFPGKQALASVTIEEQPSLKDPSKMYRQNRIEFRGYSRPDGFAYLPYDGGTAHSATVATGAPVAASRTPARKNGLAF